MRAEGTDRVFVARKNQQRSHVLLRALRREALDGCEWAYSCESVNKLLLARNPEDLVLAAEGLFPLSLNPLSKEEAGSYPRVQTVRQFKLDHEKLYKPVSGESLAHELAMLKEDASKVNMSSLRRLTDSSDAMQAEGFLRFLEGAGYEDDDIVVAEPVQDWLVAKTLLGIIVLSQARTNNMEGNQSPEEPSSCGKQARPLAYNSESLGLVKSGNLPPDGGLLALHFDLEAGTMRNAEHVKLLQGDELPPPERQTHLRRMGRRDDRQDVVPRRIRNPYGSPARLGLHMRSACDCSQREVYRRAVYRLEPGLLERGHGAQRAQGDVP